MNTIDDSGWSNTEKAVNDLEKILRVDNYDVHAREAALTRVQALVDSQKLSLLNEAERKMSHETFNVFKYGDEELSSGKKLFLSVLSRVRDAGALDANNGGEDWTQSDKSIDEAMLMIDRVVTRQIVKGGSDE